MGELFSPIYNYTNFFKILIRKGERRCGGTGGEKSVTLPLKKVYKPPALSQQTFAAYSRTLRGVLRYSTFC